MLRPSNSMAPPVGSSAARMSLEVVVLPQPDSPTRPRVSPLLIVKLMPSTALTYPRALPNRPPPTGKCFLRSRTSSSGSPTASSLGREPAARGEPVSQVVFGRLVGPAAVDGAGASGMEAATGGQGREVGGLAGNGVQRFLGPQLGNRVQQGP